MWSLHSPWYMWSTWLSEFHHLLVFFFLTSTFLLVSFAGSSFPPQYCKAGVPSPALRPCSFFLGHLSVANIWISENEWFIRMGVYWAHSLEAQGSGSYLMKVFLLVGTLFRVLRGSTTYRMTRQNECAHVSMFMSVPLCHTASPYKPLGFNHDLITPQRFYLSIPWLDLVFTPLIPA